MTYLSEVVGIFHEKISPKHSAWEEALIIAQWPEAMPLEGWEDQKIAEFEQGQEVVRTIRNMRADKKIQPGKKVPAIIVAGDSVTTIEAQRDSIISLAKLDPEQVEICETLPEPPQDAAAAVTAGIAIYLPLNDLIDPIAEKKRIEKELKEAKSQIQRLEKLLSSPFAKKAPEAVVNNERKKLATFQETVAKLQEQLDSIQ